MAGIVSILLIIRMFLTTDDEYRSLVDKYTNVRNDFETRMIVACKVG